MFHNRAVSASVARVIIYSTLLLTGLADGRAAVAQDLSPAILQLIPGVGERLDSEDISERISVLDQLLRIKRNIDTPAELLFIHDLPASDYSTVVESILAGDLQSYSAGHDLLRALAFFGEHLIGPDQH